METILIQNVRSGTFQRKPAARVDNAFKKNMVSLTSIGKTW